MKGLIAATIRSPLAHFLVIGAAIYLLYGLTGSEQADERGSDTLIVSAGDVDWLRTTWTQRWNRPPTPEELQGLIDDHVRLNVLYREAIKMGLDQGDIVIKRRLAQKLEFLFQDLADADPPTDDELLAYFEANADRYRAPDLLTFTQVFIDPDRHGDQTLPHADAVKASLVELDDPVRGASAFGDQFMLQSYYPQRSETDIAKLFGTVFARSVFELESGKWHGPVLSGYGVHLIYVHELTTPPPPLFADVSDRVREDLQAQRRQKLNDQLVERLLEQYEVVVEDAGEVEADGSAQLDEEVAPRR